MATTARPTRALAVLFTATVMTLASGATMARAAGDSPPTTPPTGSAGASGPVITVSVWGDGYQGGSSGSGGGGHVSVSVPAVCWLMSGQTGKEYYAYVTSGQAAQDNHSMDGYIGPLHGYEAYKDDDKGHWYFRVCDSSNWPDQNDMDGWSDFVERFWKSHDPTYVPANTSPPVPPMPPVLLREIAIKNLALPDPELDWNPKRTGNRGTLVNLDTWFWLDNAPTTLQVHAAAGGNEASVTATFQGMDVNAPGEPQLSCAGPGTPYTAGARTTTCALPFSRASIALGADATPVTVTTTWTGTWAANGVDQGPIATQPAPVTKTTKIRVDEVQTLVTGTR